MQWKFTYSTFVSMYFELWKMCNWNIEFVIYTDQGTADLCLQISNA